MTGALHAYHVDFLAQNANSNPENIGQQVEDWVEPCGVSRAETIVIMFESRAAYLMHERDL